jgi:pimeloyl-ACP methyl ester carboxylesterase
MNQTDIKLNCCGYNYFYRVIENGNSNFEPTLFISGAFQDMKSWKRFANAFSNETKAILTDLPGTGNSDMVGDNVSLDFFSEAIFKICKDIGVDKVFLVSASYGTPVAYTFANNYPGLVSKLVLAGTMRSIPVHMREKIMQSILLAEKNLMEEFAHYVINNGLLCLNPDRQVEKRDLAVRVIFAELKNMTREAVRKYIINTKRLLNYQSIDINKSPNVSTLVFTGEYDIFTLPEYCREIAASFSDSVFTTIKNADHLFHIERFDTTLELLLGFVRNLPLENIQGCNEFEYFFKNQPHYLETEDLQSVAFNV